MPAHTITVCTESKCATNGEPIVSGCNHGHSTRGTVVTCVSWVAEDTAPRLDNRARHLSKPPNIAGANPGHRVFSRASVHRGVAKQ